MQYTTTGGHFTAKQVGEGANDIQVLANFTAEIIKQTTIVDGMNETVQLTIKGKAKKGKLKTIVIDAKKFQSMGWVTELWGANAVIFPEANATAEMRTAIMVMSENIEDETIYQHTGWIERDGEPVYLHADGAIGKEGNNESVTVQLPADLKHYALPTLDEDDREEGKQHWHDSVALLHLASPDKMAPMLAATWRACITASDFACHCTGRSGSFKSEVTSLMQSHYGGGMDARNLPGSWSSTANAIEALAYRAKDAIFTIDDFIPVGTSWQVKQYQSSADRVMRAQGNQQGRARLTDVSSLQQTMYPRGLILSSGEDTPEGQSLRGRMMIVELSKGDVCTDKLTAAQAARGSYPKAMAGFIQWLAKGRDAKLEAFQATRLEFRDTFRGMGHARTPQMAADLLASARMWIQYGQAMGYVDEESAESIEYEFYEAIKGTAADQTRFIVESDPAESFVSTLRAGFMAGRFHLRSVEGQRPDSPRYFGWDEDQSGTVYSYKPRGCHIGWVDEDKKTIYLEASVGYEEIRKQSSGSLTITATTLWKRLKEADIINAIDEKRQRNTVRLTIKGVTKTVAAIDMTKIVELEEVDDDHGPF